AHPGRKIHQTARLCCPDLDPGRHRDIRSGRLCRGALGRRHLHGELGYFFQDEPDRGEIAVTVIYLVQPYFRKRRSHALPTTRRLCRRIATCVIHSASYLQRGRLHMHSRGRTLIEPGHLLVAATIFAGAFLLFALEPLIAKTILPWFGGSAQVWTICLL